ncbi:deoxyguanosinetriphosphate triphosphohydrolase [Amnimonas aquatica]|nr:deoxyguanosinetriphosphate triphosphohydrolase [Amnimonas aquatica]
MAQARMNWSQLLSARRFKIKHGEVLPTRAGASEDGVAGLRSEFHIDHDRVVFSSAFRRLGRKTQVHPLAQHDHTHNRLTHSVEVASVGRSLGNRVGAMLSGGGHLPAEGTPFDIGSIVQVACLAHDLGNPPFGHTGEYAMRDWFREPAHLHLLDGLGEAERHDIQTYEGNAHSLRLLSTLEMYTGEGGMRMTAATLGASVKYPWTAQTFPARGKFNIYQAELSYYRQVAAELGLIERGAEHWARHPLSYLMEAADDICYAIVDLEDAVEIGILDLRELEELLAPIVDPDKVWQIREPRQYAAALRGTMVGRCVKDLADVFMRHHDALMAGEFPLKDLIAGASGDVRETLDQAKQLARDKVYRHRSKVVTEVAAYPCLGVLLDALVPNVRAFCLHGPDALSHRQQTQLALLERPLAPGMSLYDGYLRVLDEVGGMTDNHAARLAREISGIGLI